MKQRNDDSQKFKTDANDTPIVATVSEQEPEPAGVLCGQDHRNGSRLSGRRFRFCLQLQGTP